MRPMRRFLVPTIFGGLLLAAAIVAGVGWAVFLLWNWLMPTIFGLHAITYWQGIGLLVLSGILFRGFHPYRGRRWRHGMRERWGRMTPEEREEFMKGLRTRWAGASSPEPDPKA